VKRICFFGDSYLGSLLNAQGEFNIFKEGEVDFFGAADPYLRKDPLKIDAIGIYSTTEKVEENFRFTGKKDFIKFCEYDVLVLVGYFSRSMFMFSLMDSGCVWVPSRYYRNTGYYHMITEDFYENFILQGAREKADLAMKIRENFKGEIYVIQQPFCSEESPQNSEFRRSIPIDVKMRFVEDYWACTERFWAERDMCFLSQPKCTLGSFAFTRHDYSIGSRRIVDNSLHRSTDFDHMNEIYGKLVLEQLDIKL